MTYKTLSKLAAKGIPYLFYTDFSGKDIHCYRLDELQNEDIEFSLENNFSKHDKTVIKHPVEFKEYKKKFNQVIEYIKSGDTYLLNLTQPTPIESALSLKEIFKYANAPFKLRVKDQFVCFSPERFVRIEGNRITTYPMKGTIDASIPDAKTIILANEKEMAEHIMVVDLLRNDLGIVAKNIKVENFRYIKKIEAGEKSLLQVSSKISGTLEENWHKNIGEIIKKLLPAGSISGTPKKRTVEIIQEIEGYERGYFCGVFGIFDGSIFDSAVMIRFIENKDGQTIYKSGGGITLQSNVQDEYHELIDKIYIP